MRQHNGRILLFFALLALTNLAAACETTKVKGGVKEPGPKGSKNEFVSSARAQVDIKPIDRKKIPNLKDSEYWAKVRKGTLRIVVGSNLPPFSMKSKDKRIGFDIALARIMAKTLGVKVEFIELPTSQVLDAISGPNPKADIAIASLTRTASRAVQVNFTEPYLVVSQAAIIEKRLIDQDRDRAEISRATYESYADLEKLRGLKIGVKANTTPESYARSFFKDSGKVIGYKTLGEAFAALKAGKVQAVTHDAPAIRLWSRQNSSLTYRFATLLKPVTEDAICMAIRKGDLEFLQWLNAFIAELRSDGAIQALRKEYIVDMTWLKSQ
ncbi:MAG: transporter substrate-binding domain-containing protein [Planctomycetota bacterium]|nr:transporter substrate-binding domain-containing protein [Planctomycetota bacterium]